jgi:hypothetical protein
VWYNWYSIKKGTIETVILVVLKIEYYKNPN